jgi:hypothetical protein
LRNHVVTGNAVSHQVLLFGVMSFHRSRTTLKVVERNSIVFSLM